MYQSPFQLWGPSNNLEPSSCLSYPKSPLSSAISQTSPRTSRSDEPKPVLNSLITRRYGVLPTLTLVVLAPILWDCSPFQGRHIAAIIPLFLCAVLFFTVELARGARALERLADYRRQGYLDFSDHGRTPILSEDPDGTTDVQSITPSSSIDDPPAIRRTLQRPWKTPGSIDLETAHAEQAAPHRLGGSRVGSWYSLSTSSMSVRGSLADFLGGIDGSFAGSIACTLPRERGPYYLSYYVKRWCNELPQVDLGEYQSDPEDQSELDDRQLDPDERRLPEVW